MRYRINFDKTINQLVPYYMGGRKLILYLQALMKPLQQLNDWFVEYAKETRIEVAMTSQILKFEWYLNHKFSKYLKNGGRITITNSEQPGTPIWHQSANLSSQSDNMLIHTEAEKTATRQLILYRSDEQTDKSSVSFYVTTPQIDTKLISESKYIAMLKYVIDKYRIANKTYIIKYES